MRLAHDEQAASAPWQNQRIPHHSRSRAGKWSCAIRESPKWQSPWIRWSAQRIPVVSRCRKHQAHLFKTGPVLGPATPSKAQEAIDLLLQGLGHPVADGREVRNQADVPEHQGTEKYVEMANTSHKQGELKVDPKRSKLVRKRQHPVAHPDPAHVNAREDRRHDDRENGHGLRRAVDGHPPLLAEQQQHRRNQAFQRVQYPPTKRSW